MNQPNIDIALSLAADFGDTDGAHHKMWVIDQMVRALCGDEASYEEWRHHCELNFGFEWDEGIAP